MSADRLLLFQTRFNRPRMESGNKKEMEKKNGKSEKPLPRVFRSFRPCYHRKLAWNIPLIQQASIRTQPMCRNNETWKFNSFFSLLIFLSSFIFIIIMVSFFSLSLVQYKLLLPSEKFIIKGIHIHIYTKLIMNFCI